MMYALRMVDLVQIGATIDPERGILDLGSNATRTRPQPQPRTRPP